MDWLKPTHEFVERWWAYVDWCISAELQASVCRPFWTSVMIASLIIGAVVAAWVATKVISQRRKLSAALTAQAERLKVADPETIRAYTWEGDNAHPTQESAEDIQRRIKEALVERRNRERPPSVV